MLTKSMAFRGHARSVTQLAKQPYRTDAAGIEPPLFYRCASGYRLAHVRQSETQQWMRRQ